MPAAEVIAKYHDLWHVEQSFRMSKTDLRARPMFHRTRDADRSAPDHRVHRPGRRAPHPGTHRPGHRQRHQATRPLRIATIAINGTTETFPPEIPAPNEKSGPASASKPGH